MEHILQENPERFSIFPIKYMDLWQMYKKHESMHWTAQEVDLSQDTIDWDLLNSNEQHFIKNILAFFNSSDNVVTENIALNFLSKVQYPEARFFYTFQAAMEDVHSECYSLMVDTYIKDIKEKASAFNAINEYPAVKKKFDWAMKYIAHEDFRVNLVAFSIVEGLFFSGAFCSIFWIKERSLMPGLCEYNRLINRDESMHYHFATYLYNNYIMYKLEPSLIREIILSAYEIEREFITVSLPVDLIGMNADLMTQYIQFVADGILMDYDLPAVFGVESPFPFMDKIALENKNNFFEGRTTEYVKADLTGSISFDEEF